MNFMRTLRLIKKKEIWVLTLWGWVALFATACLCGGAVVLNINSFLSPIQRVAPDVLVVEGWLPDYALEYAAREFKSRPYHLCIVTGGPMEAGTYLSNYKTFADIAYETLRKLGIDSGQIVAVPSPLVNKDRTYASSVALRQWFDKTGYRVGTVNVFSLGCHSRRSRMLFAKALGNHIPVGVIACYDNSYDSRRWWHYSSGIRMVTGEGLAYVYGILFSLKE
jgi:hypothetical protein